MTTSFRPTRSERYGSAAASGRLTFSVERRTAADVVAAAGMAATVEHLGLALWRVRYANDRSAFRHGQALLLAKVMNVARRRRWQEQPKVIKLLAFRVFQWAVFSVCPVCTGRGHPTLDGQPMALSDDLCPACHGDGVTAIENTVPVQHIGRAKDIADILWQSDQHLDLRIAARLALHMATRPSTIDAAAHRGPGVPGHNSNDRPPLVVSLALEKPASRGL